MAGCPHSAFPGPWLSRRRALALSAGVIGAPFCGWMPSAAQSGPSPLLTRPIPHSGEPLPVIGLGTAYVFDVGDDAQQRHDRSEVIRTLVAGGGRIVDTAPSYGTADAVVGEAIAGNGVRGEVFLATKLEDFSRADGPAEFQGSLRRLKVERVDLMQLHNVSDPRQDLAMLREWKAQGLCRYVGITTTFKGAFDAVEAVLRREKPDFVQVDYSLDDRQAERRILPAAADAGAAVLTAMPFGRNRLFRAVQGRPLPDWAKDFDVESWGQFFLKYLLANPAVTAVIPGTGNPGHMADNLGAGRGRLPDAAGRARMVEFIGSLG